VFITVHNVVFVCIIEKKNVIVHLSHVSVYGDAIIVCIYSRIEQIQKFDTQLMLGVRIFAAWHSLCVLRVRQPAHPAVTNTHAHALTHTHIFTHIHTHTYARTYTHTHTHTHTHIHKLKHTKMHKYTHMLYIDTHTHTHTQTHTHTHTHTTYRYTLCIHVQRHSHTHTHTHTHKHTHTYNLVMYTGVAEEGCVVSAMCCTAVYCR
jgi:hypothetical protein